MTACANKSCARGPKGKRAEARRGGRYCCDTCSIYVRVRRLRKRRKDGVKLVPCDRCEGSGYVKADIDTSS